MNQRVVVTGLGAVSPLGLGVGPTWQALVSGQSGVVTLDDDLNGSLEVNIAATVKGFDATQYLNPKDIKKMGLFIQYGLAASEEALKDAALLNAIPEPERVGVALGSGIGGLEVIAANHTKLEQSGPRRVSPFFIPGSIANMAAGQVSIKHGLQGPNLSIVTACTTGAHNIALAHRMIAYGDADVMLAGGTEMSTIPLGIAGFDAARALSRSNADPQKASRPWDKGRDGFVLGEGAAVLILESEAHAKARGAKIHAVLQGCGMSADAYHMTSPSGKGAVKAMEVALKDAKLNPEQIDYINAHATSTVAGDIAEVDAIKEVFADHAYELAVSSTKSMTGHLLGAAGSLEAIISVLAIRDQICPPTINLDDPDTVCDLNFVPYIAQERTVQHVLSNSFGFGGTNGALIFSKYEDEH